MKAAISRFEAVVAVFLGLAGAALSVYLLRIAFLLLQPPHQAEDLDAAILGPWIAGIALFGSALLFVGSVGVFRGHNWGRSASVVALVVLAFLDTAFFAFGLKQDLWFYALLLPVLLGPIGLYLFTLFRRPQRPSA